jgi:hypothetical protein
MVVLVELVGFWIVLWYSNMRDVYMVNIMIRLGLVLYIVNVKRWLSVLLLIIIIPLLGGYVRMLNRMMRRIYINESLKKIMVLIFVMSVGRVIVE